MPDSASGGMIFIQQVEYLPMVAASLSGPTSAGYRAPCDPQQPVRLAGREVNRGTRLPVQTVHCKLSLQCSALVIVRHFQPETLPKRAPVRAQAHTANKHRRDCPVRMSVVVGLVVQDTKSWHSINEWFLRVSRARLGLARHFRPIDAISDLRRTPSS